MVGTATLNLLNNSWPSIDKAKMLSPIDLQATSAKINALNMKNDLLKSSIIRELNEKGLIHLYAGYYHLKTGKVDLLNDLEECYERNHND